MSGYEWHDFVGNFGVLCVLGSYLLLQMEKIAPNGRGYLLANALGALLILISLAYNFNLSAFLIESAWLVISVYGLVRVYLKAA